MNQIGPLIDELVARRPVVTDGAWGTRMPALGLPAGHLPDRWNLVRPDLVELVAASYVAAGSRVLLTNTFRSNRYALGVDADVDAINRAGARISRRAAGARASVFGSIGPTHAMSGSGAADLGAVRAAFVEQAVALARGGADGLVIETMSDLDEAVLAVGAAAEVGLPVVACMTFERSEHGDRTATGVGPAEAARRLVDAGADAIGANCGAGIDRALPICEALVAASELPVWIKAGVGDPGRGGVTRSATADDFAERAPSLVDAGASFVGGCCGTTPEFVAAIADVLG